MNGMAHAILEVVAGGIVQTASDINRYVRCTLLNSTKSFQDVVKSAQESLRWLCQRKFLEWNEDTKLYNTTPLGRASFGSSLCPEESLVSVCLLLFNFLLLFSFISFFPLDPFWVYYSQTFLVSFVLEYIRHVNLMIGYMTC